MQNPQGLGLDKIDLIDQTLVALAKKIEDTGDKDMVNAFLALLDRRFDNASLEKVLKEVAILRDEIERMHKFLNGYGYS